MTPTPPPPPATPSNVANVVKMVGGYAVALGCLALVAFNNRLGIGLSPDTTALLLVGVLGGGIVGSHGALKTPAGDAQ